MVGVGVPGGLAADGPVAGGYAAAALLLGVVLQYVSAVILVLIQVSLGVDVAWAEVARVPVDVFGLFEFGLQLGGRLGE